MTVATKITCDECKKELYLSNKWASDDVIQVGPYDYRKHIESYNAPNNGPIYMHRYLLNHKEFCSFKCLANWAEKQAEKDEEQGYLSREPIK